MSVFFELLDTSSGNFVKDFETEREAFEALEAVGREYGREQLRGLALLCFQNGHPTLIARDDDLVALLNADEKTHQHKSFHFRRATRVTSATTKAYVTFEFLQSLGMAPQGSFQIDQLTATRYLESSCVA